MTTRGPAGDDRAHHEAGGLGLGLFIAKTLLERTGARLTFRNLDPPRRGAVGPGGVAAGADGFPGEDRRRNQSLRNGLRGRGKSL